MTDRPFTSTTPSGAAGGKPVSWAHEQLNTLFAKFNNVFNFNENSQRYNSPIPAPPTSANKTEGATGARKAPKILSVGTCYEGDKCLEGLEGITVNNISVGSVRISEGASVNLKFFAYADKNQMPIRKVRINWGDSPTMQESGEPSFFRNQRGYVKLRTAAEGGVNPVSCYPIAGSDRKCKVIDWSGGATFTTQESCASDNDCAGIMFPLCAADSASAPDFGHIGGQSCENRYLRYTHTYACSDSSPYWVADCSVINRSVRGGCCVFEPKVQVKDNWGWCNGTCGDAASPGGVGCYDKSWYDLDDECKDPWPLGRGWTPATVKVLVVPTTVTTR